MDFSMDQNAFGEVFLVLLEDIRAEAERLGTPSVVVDHIEKCFEENVKGGKVFRGRAVIETGSALLGRALSMEEFRNLSILGWLVEMLQGYLLIMDDIMDGSMTRRGKPCWYKRPEIGLMAVNDGCLIKSMIFFLLKKYFRHHSSYIQMFESIEEVSFLTEVGQASDSIAANEEDPCNWTWEQYYTIATFKSGYYSFYLSALLALQYLGLASPSNVQHTKKILVELGTFYQVQNDFLDVFSHSAQTGKIGSDIAENKCAWVIIKALEVCNDEQRVFLQKNYGQSDPDVMGGVQSLFQSLPLSSLYDQDEHCMRTEFNKMVSQIPEGEGLKGDVFMKLLSCIDWCNQNQRG